MYLQEILQSVTNYFKTYLLASWKLAFYFYTTKRKMLESCTRIIHKTESKSRKKTVHKLQPQVEKAMHKLQAQVEKTIDKQVEKLKNK